MLQDKMLSLEAKVRGRVEDCDVLQAQVQKAEVERKQLEEKIQSMRILLEADEVREAAICVEKNQLQSRVQAKIEQDLSLEQVIKQLQEIMDQLTTKIGDTQESEAQCVHY